MVSLWLADQARLLQGADVFALESVNAVVEVTCRHPADV